MLNKFKLNHIELINYSGGIVSDDLFVEKVGVLLTKKSSVTSKAQSLFERLNIDTDLTETEQHAEFNSRLTYLSFKDKKSDSKSYHDKMINILEHRSVYNDEIVSFLIAGCSIETMLEFMAHNEATIARLTSSKTKAQDENLYRLRTKNCTEHFIATQKHIINQFEENRIANRKLIDESNAFESEVFNIMSLGCKAVSFTITMSIKDWHKTFIGRLSNQGVESEMIEILNDISDILNNEYNHFFKSKEEYFSMGNGKKYE